MCNFQMNDDWLNLKKEYLDNLIKRVFKKRNSQYKDLKTCIFIDREKEPKIVNWEKIKWKDFNEYLNKYLREKKDFNEYLNKYLREKLDEPIDLKREETSEEKISIADILGEYKFEDDTHKIILYEKNINKCCSELKNYLILVLRNLAVFNVPRYSNRNHFPLEIKEIRDALTDSKNYEVFIEKLSSFLIGELYLWGELDQFFNELKGKEKDEVLEVWKEKIQHLNICNRELFGSLYEVVFLHEVGHLIENVLLNGKLKDENTKEAFADLMSLYLSPTLKDKVTFYSLAQASNDSWFKYYKNLNNNKEFFIIKNDIDFADYLIKFFEK